MRILFLSPWFPYPLDTGSRTRIYYLLQALTESHSVTLLTLDPAGWAPAQVEPISNWFDHTDIISKDPFQRSWWRTRTRFFSLSPIVTYPFPELVQEIKALHRQQPFDLVVAVTTIMASYAFALPKIPRILEEHNSHTRWMAERYQQQTSLAQKVRCWLSWRKSYVYESRLFKRFDHITMVSEEDLAATHNLLVGEYTSVSLIPNGVDCQKSLPNLAKPEPNTLIFSGSLTYQANYEAMVYFLEEVYPLIRTQNQAVKLRITGAMEGVSLNLLHLDESVTLTGFVDDIHREIAGAAISVVPILSGGGTRLKILEAMALGVPVVATLKGAEGLEVEHGKHLLLAETPEDFAVYTLQLLSNETMRRRLIKSARQLVVEKYDWTNIGQQFVNLIEQTYQRTSQKEKLL